MLFRVVVCCGIALAICGCSASVPDDPPLLPGASKQAISGSQAGVAAVAYVNSYHGLELNGSKSPGFDLRDGDFYIIVRFRSRGSYVPSMMQLTIGATTVCLPVLYRVVNSSGSAGFGWDRPTPLQFINASGDGDLDLLFAIPQTLSDERMMLVQTPFRGLSREEFIVPRLPPVKKK